MSQVYKNIIAKTQFQPNKEWLQIKTIDMHTGGEPLRVIIDGFPELKGKTILESRNYCKENFDYLRTALMFEPRGHADMYGCILLPPNDKSGDFGIIFLHNEGYSTMCGHAIIAISTLAVLMHWIDVKEGDNIIKIDTPCGRITSYANVINGRVIGVRFHGVPSFVVGLDRTINIEGLGNVTYDLAYGGAFYAYVDMNKHNFNFDLNINSYGALINNGMAIKHAVMNNDKDILHPFEDDLSFLYGTIFVGNSKKDNVDSRNVCIFAEGEVDRCPTGSGISGRIAIHKARKEINYGDVMIVEGITDSTFKGSIVSELVYDNFPAVIPEVEGTAYVTGIQTFVFDPNDSIKNGFLLR